MTRAFEHSQSKEFQINCSSVDQAKLVFLKLIPILEQTLHENFLRDFEVQTKELGDVAEDVSGVTTLENKDASLYQEFLILKGWKIGAQASLIWNARNPSILLLRSEITTKLQDHLFYLFTTLPGLSMASIAMFSAKLKLFKMLFWGLLGYGAGALVYTFSAFPIIRFLIRKEKEISEELRQRAFQKLSLTLERSAVERLG